jgi:hypothetical protein
MNNKILIITYFKNLTVEEAFKNLNPEFNKLSEVADNMIAKLNNKFGKNFNLSAIMGLPEMMSEGMDIIEYMKKKICNSDTICLWMSNDDTTNSILYLMYSMASFLNKEIVVLNGDDISGDTSKLLQYILDKSEREPSIIS